MRRTLKIVSFVLASLAVIVGALAVYVAWDGVPRYPVAALPDLHVAVTPERVARGRELVALTCVGCHEDPKTHRLTGKRMGDLPPEFGVAYAPNITQHRENGIGGWSDAQLEHLLRTGLRPDGQYTPPWMVKMPHTSDEDLHAIVAFLRSDDPIVAPSDVTPMGQSQPSFLVKALTHVVWKPLPMPAAPLIAPSRTDKVAYGRYMAFALDCFSCHADDFKKVNMLAPEKTPGYMAGGNRLLDAAGAEVFSANITPDPETGIGGWSEADFVRAVKQGFRPDGRVLHYPMEPRPALGDDEAAALFAYLRTIPAIKKVVPRPSDLPHPMTASAGERVYTRYGCPACHGTTGVGLEGAADLREANEHFPTDQELRAWIDQAPALRPGTRMPGWAGVIQELDYEPLIAHVRAIARGARQALLE